MALQACMRTLGYAHSMELCSWHEPCLCNNQPSYSCCHVGLHTRPYLAEYASTMLSWGKHAGTSVRCMGALLCTLWTSWMLAPAASWLLSQVQMCKYQLWVKLLMIITQAADGSALSQRDLMSRWLCDHATCVQRACMPQAWLGSM